MIRLTQLLTPAEFDALNDGCKARGWYHTDRRAFTPGMGWYCPWNFDPADPNRWRARYGSNTEGGVYPCKPGNTNYLSAHYWRDHAATRPPICVVLPNGEQWEIDRKSSNGEGWTVTGEWPLLSATPSIAARGYHGFLGSNGAPPGEFTADLDRPGEPNGVWPYP